MSHFKNELEKSRAFIANVGLLIEWVQLLGESDAAEAPCKTAQDLFNRACYEQDYDAFWEADILGRLSQLDRKNKNHSLSSLLRTAPNEYKTGFICQLIAFVNDGRLDDIQWNALFPLLVNDNGQLYLDKDRFKWDDLLNGLHFSNADLAGELGQQINQMPPTNALALSRKRYTLRLSHGGSFTFNKPSDWRPPYRLEQFELN